jgi:hypothetical protein
MPRVNVPITQITRDGVAPPAVTNGDATNNHTIVNDGAVWFEVDNADAGGAHNVTVLFTQMVDGQAVASRAYAIASSASRRIGPWPVAMYGSALQVNVASSQLKLRAWRLGT